MKTLYISDLDGTLLDKQAQVSDITREKLNGLIKDGMFFSVATARTEATVKKIIAGVNINVPVVLMNGVAVYDLEEHRYIDVKGIGYKGKKHLTEKISLNGSVGFIYCIDNDELSTYYLNTNTPNAEKFIEERQRLYGKSFTKAMDFTECINKNIVYYSVSDRLDKLEMLYNELSECNDLHIEFYRDVYCEDFWYLEVCAESASKFNAVNFLRERYGFERIVGFGDNLNDLPLFKACDECYAVENAKPEVQAAANGVIGANFDDSVAAFLCSRYLPYE